MQTITEQAFAKLNLTLDVLCRRADGYHDICSVEQTVSLHDDVEIFVQTKKPWTLSCVSESFAADLPQDEKNLAWKAAKAFFDRTGIDCGGLQIEITKRIPSEAGLGGGSSDAAAVLRGLNGYYGKPLSTAALCALGATVGADVPFLVLGGTALCEGRGELLTPLAPAPKMYFAVCKPDFACATAELYRKLDEADIKTHPDAQAMMQRLREGSLADICACMGNVFEPVAASEHPEIYEICNWLRASGALGAQMTGSGSAVFGVFETEDAAKAACAALDGSGLRCFFATTV